MKEALKSLADKLPLRKRATIETINDKLKNIARVKHSRYRTFDYFIVNLLSANAAYCCFPQNCVSMLWELLTHNKFSAFITAPTYSPIFLNVNHAVKGLWRGEGGPFSFYLSSYILSLQLSYNTAWGWIKEQGMWLRYWVTISSLEVAITEDNWGVNLYLQWSCCSSSVSVFTRNSISQKLWYGFWYPSSWYVRSMYAYWCPAFLALLINSDLILLRLLGTDDVTRRTPV